MAPRHEVYAGHALRQVSCNNVFVKKISKGFFLFYCHGNQHHGGNRNR